MNEVSRQSVQSVLVCLISGVHASGGQGGLDGGHGSSLLLGQLLHALGFGRGCHCDIIGQRSWEEVISILQQIERTMLLELPTIPQKN